MSTTTPVTPSGSTNGKQIKLAAIATPGTLIHTAVTGITSFDEIWLWVTNNHTAAVDLVVEWGGAADPDNVTKMNIPSKSGDYLIKAGIRLNNGLEVRAYASVANVLCISANINRWAP